MGFFSLNLSKPKAPTPLSKTSMAMEIQIKETLGIQKLDSMPLQAARAFQLASDPKAKTHDFVKVIEADEVLSARIIRVANSVYFRRGEEAKDIERAVANIGLNELRCLISATMLRSLLQGKQAAREQVWANAVGTAIACRFVSRYTNFSEGEAFLAGLLHDVGKLIMIRQNAKSYDQVMQIASHGEKTFLQAEEEVFDLNHVEVGKWIAERWRFPEHAIRAITFHHHSWATEPNSQGKGTSHAMLVKCADTLAHAAGIGLPSSYRPVQHSHIRELPKLATQLQINTQEVQGLVEQLKKQFDQENALYQAENL